MFRDESDKVMQKAHAQWGVGEDQDTASQSTASSSHDPSSSSSSKSPTLLPLRSATTPAHTLPSPPPSQMGSSTKVTPHIAETNPLISSVSPTMDEQGFQFYVNRYLIGHPDEPRHSGELQDYQWLWSPTLRDVSAAVGLASLSNLKNDSELMIHARSLYGSALRTAGQLIQSNSTVTVDITSQLVVMLALFEVCTKTT